MVITKKVSDFKLPEGHFLTAGNFSEYVFIPALIQGVTHLEVTEEEFGMVVTNAAHNNQFAYTHENGEVSRKAFGIELVVT